MLIAIAARVYEPAPVSQLHEVGTKDQVRLGIHHHDVFSRFKRRDCVPSRVGDGVGGFDEDGRIDALGHEIAILADCSKTVPDGVVHLSRGACHLVPQSLDFSALDRPFGQDVRQRNAFDTRRYAELVHESLPHGAHTDESNPDGLPERGQSSKDGSRGTNPLRERWWHSRIDQAAFFMRHDTPSCVAWVARIEPCPLRIVTGCGVTLSLFSSSHVLAMYPPTSSHTTT